MLYGTYGNPTVQFSENAQQFNSKKMKEFAKSRDMQLETTAPYHPNSILLLRHL